MKAPDLLAMEGSWIVTRLRDGAQREIFRADRKCADQFAAHPGRFKVVSILTHLAEVQAVSAALQKRD